MDTLEPRLASISPRDIAANPYNPRRYFNEEQLDLLRTSIQETGVLVPLILYAETEGDEKYILLDGERRWRCAIDLGLETVPATIRSQPTRLGNLLEMFNIHNVREDWPLVSVALSLRDVIDASGVTTEKRLAEMTGLSRSTVRRARRLLSIPDEELERVRAEAHLPRSEQVHREDLYLEIEAAESVLTARLPEIGAEYNKATIFRAFAEKAETRNLPNVTDFRYVGKLVKAIDDDVVSRSSALHVARQLVEDRTLSPRLAFEIVAAEGYAQQSLVRKAQLLAAEVRQVTESAPVLSAALREELEGLRDAINVMLGRAQ